jgi:hypothetical protein
MQKIMRLIEILFKHESMFINSQNEMRHNARINRAGRIERSLQSLRMKDKLIPLRLNERLGFVRSHHASFPHLSTFDSSIQRTNRRLAIQPTLSSTCDFCARLTAFK